MRRFVQLKLPAVGAIWTEYFYDGEARVVRNVVEIPDNKDGWAWILAEERGYRELGADEPHPYPLKVPQPKPEAPPVDEPVAGKDVTNFLDVLKAEGAKRQRGKAVTKDTSINTEGET